MQKATSFLAGLVGDRHFLDSWIHPLLERAQRVEGWYVAHSHEAPEGSCSLQVFFWPLGSEIQIHDHSSWGAFCCTVGSVVEERYERLDEASCPTLLA